MLEIPRPRIGPALPRFGNVQRESGRDLAETDIEPGIMRRLGRSSLGGLVKLGSFLDLPGSMVRDVLAFKNPLDQLLTPFSPDNRTTGRDLARQYGIIGKRDTWGNFAGGLAAEIALDPLTYLTFGATASGKGLTTAGKVAQRAGIYDDAVRLSVGTGKQPGLMSLGRVGQDLGVIGKNTARTKTTLGESIGLVDDATNEFMAGARAAQDVTPLEKLRNAAQINDGSKADLDKLANLLDKPIRENGLLTEAGVLAKNAGVLVPGVKGDTLGDLVRGLTDSPLEAVNIAPKSAEMRVADAAKALGVAVDDKLLSMPLGYTGRFMGMPFNNRTLSQGIDMLGNSVAFGPIGSRAAGLFDYSAQGATTETGIKAARIKTSMREQAIAKVREEIAAIEKPVTDALSAIKYADDPGRTLSEQLSATSYLEGHITELPDSLAPIKGHLDKLASMNRQLFDIETSMGLNTRALDDLSSLYFPRVRKFMAEDDKSIKLSKTLQQDDTAVFNTRHGHQAGRQSGMRHLAGGTETLQKMSVDKRFSGIAHKDGYSYGTSFEAFRKAYAGKLPSDSIVKKQIDMLDDNIVDRAAVRKKIAGDLEPDAEFYIKQHGEEGYRKLIDDLTDQEVEKVRLDKLNELATESDANLFSTIANLDPRHAEHGVPMFNINPVEAAIRRLEYGIGAVQAASTVYKIIGQHAVVRSEAGEGFVPVSKGILDSDQVGLRGAKADDAMYRHLPNGTKQKLEDFLNNERNLVQDETTGDWVTREEYRTRRDGQASQDAMVFEETTLGPEQVDTWELEDYAKWISGIEEAISFRGIKGSGYPVPGQQWTAPPGGSTRGSKIESISQAAGVSPDRIIASEIFKLKKMAAIANNSLRSTTYPSKLNADELLGNSKVISDWLKENPNAMRVAVGSDVFSAEQAVALSNPKVFSAISENHKKMNEFLEHLQKNDVFLKEDADILRMIFSQSTLDNLPSSVYSDINLKVKGSKARGVAHLPIKDIKNTQIGMLANSDASALTFLHEMSHVIFHQIEMTGPSHPLWDAMEQLDQVVMGNKSYFSDQLKSGSKWSGDMFNPPIDSAVVGQFRSAHAENYAQYYMSNRSETYAQLFADSIIKRKIPDHALASGLSKLQTWIVDMLSKIRAFISGSSTIDQKVISRVDELMDKIGGFNKPPDVQSAIDRFKPDVSASTPPTPKASGSVAGAGDNAAGPAGGAGAAGGSGGSSGGGGASGGAAGGGGLGGGNRPRGDINPPPPPPPKTPSGAEYRPGELGASVYVPQEVAEQARRVMRAFQGPEAADDLLGLYDKATNLFKGGVTSIFPGFHTRNFISGQFQNWIGGVFGAGTKTSFSQYANDIKGSVDLSFGKTVKGLSEIEMFKGMTDAEATRKLAELAYAHGLVGNQGWINDLLGDPLAEALSQKIPGAVHPWHNTKAAATNPNTSKLNKALGFLAGRTKGVFAETDEAVLSAAGRDVGNLTENANRIAPFISLLREGFDPAAAANKVKALQVDYSRLSQFERIAMRRVFPFYSFTRGVIPFHVKELMQTPGGRLGKTVRTINSAKSASPVLPEYIADTAAIPTPWGAKNEDDDSYITGFGLMLEDPLSMVGGLRQTGLEALSRANPLIKGPAEWITGQTFFQKTPFGGRPLEDLDPTLGRLAANVAGGSPEDYKIPRSIEAIVGNSPLARIATTGRQLTDPRKSILDKALNLVTGVRQSNVSEANRDAILREKASELMRQLGAKEFTRTYFPEDLLKKMSEGGAATAQELEALIAILGNRSKARRGMLRQ